MDDQKDNKPGFKPAKNPFLSGLGLGGGSKQTEQSPPEPETKEVVVGNTQATLVGKPAGQKTDNFQVGEPENKVPEQILYQWQAPEFAYTQKPIGWYLAVLAFFAGLCVLAFFFIGSNLQKYVTIGLLAVMAVAAVVWASRRPKVLSYVVSNYGITINAKKYNFDDFRAFYQYMDYNQASIDLVPSKRFGTMVSMPLATPEADEIVETIAYMVPEVEHQEDVVDRIVRRLRF